MSSANPVGLYFAFWRLTIDATLVVALRIHGLTRCGGGSVSEAQRMISEKAESVIRLQRKAALGRLGMHPIVMSRRTIDHFQSTVGKNRQRLVNAKRR